MSRNTNMWKGITPRAGIEPASPEGLGLAIRCNTTMRSRHEDIDNQQVLKLTI